MDSSNGCHLKLLKWMRTINMEWQWLDHCLTDVLKEKKKTHNFEELEQLLKSVTLEDKIRHIFTVDIEFSDINPKTLLFHEIYLPIFEKNKKTPPHLWSCSQIMSKSQKKKGKKRNCFFTI